MSDMIDFGDVGIKIGDVIVFAATGDKFVVCSGEGVPGNGGTLVKYADSSLSGLHSIRSLARKLMGDSFSEEVDVFEKFRFNSESLRKIYNEKRAKEAHKRISE